MKNLKRNKIESGKKLTVLLALLILNLSFINVLIAGDFLGETGGLEANQNTEISENLSLNLKVYLQGFWNGSTQVIDTVKVYLAKSSYPFSFADSNKAILSAFGTSTVIFTNAPSGSYYIVIKHRNHLETWSALPQSFNSDKPTNYDFTIAKSQAYNCNMKNEEGNWCLYAGDINQDGFINIPDMVRLDSALLNYVSGWVDEDLNGDLFVDLDDMFILDSNIFMNVRVLSPFNEFSVINNPEGKSNNRKFAEKKNTGNLTNENGKKETETLSSIKNENKTVSGYSLSQNYPNPFNPVTKINFNIPEQSNVSLKIYDISGKEVKILVNDVKSAGSYTVSFNGAELSSGVYFYKIQTRDYAETKSMMLVK